jgi:hypothetical protein
MQQIVILSIATTPHTAMSTFHFPQAFPPIIFLFSVAGAFIVFVRFWSRPSVGLGRRLAPPLLLALLLAAALGLAACGGVVGGSSQPPQLNPTTGTPAGNYTISITATSGAVAHSTSVTLSIM